MTTVVWLLERFQIAESVTGDIVERFSTKKSRSWLWRQACGAVGVAVFQDVRRNPWRAVRAIAVGLLLIAGIEKLLAWNELSFDSWVGQKLLNEFRPSRASLILLVSLANASVAAPAWLAVGWLIARMHGARSVLLIIGVVAWLSAPHYIRQISHAFGDPTFVRYRTVHIAIMAIWLITFAVALLAGGLSGDNRQGVAAG